jgi:transcriptional regulator with XRE-family HTH domain
MLVAGYLGEERRLASLAEFLSEARASSGMSLREVERATGVHNAHLSQIEKGRIDRPDVGLLWQLSQLYEVDLLTLMELAGHVVNGSVRDDASARSVASAAMRAVGNLSPSDQAKALAFLHRFRRKPDPDLPSLTAQAERRIASIAERALVWADAAGNAPTKLDDVAAAAGVLRFDATANLPPEAQQGKPSHWKRILGAVMFPARVIYVDQDLEHRRANFTKAHETAHVLLPWHETAYLLDDERRLFYGTREELEVEANVAAAHLIFQGHRYHEAAMEYETSIRTPIALADQYDASMHASIRYYVEHHPEPVAGLVAGRYAQHDGSLPVWTTFASPSFTEQFGSLGDFLPTSGLPLDSADVVVGRLAKAAFTATDAPSETIHLPDLAGDQHRFAAEAFFNQYTMFVTVSAKRRIPRGRRTRLETSVPGSPRREH